MTTVVVLVGALTVLAFVFYWSGRYGGRHRGGTSLRRGPSAHTTSKGRPKVAYATREQAEEQARTMQRRDGAAMSAYRCSTCSKWHVGHLK